MSLRDEVGAILGEKITTTSWDTVFNQLDRQGRITPALTNRILLLLCKKLDDPKEPNTPAPTYNLFNPLTDDFSFEILNNANIPVKYILKSQEITEFKDKSVFELMLKHLTDAVSNSRSETPQIREDIIKEVTMSV